MAATWNSQHKIQDVPPSYCLPICLSTGLSPTHPVTKPSKFSKAFPEKVIVIHLAMKLHAIMEPKVSSPHHKSPPMNAILSQLNPFHTITAYYFKILLISSIIGYILGSEAAYLLKHFDQNTVYESNFFLSSFATCPTHFTLIRLIIILIPR
jgi:hypothetical protein